jgi:hypothetical protein
MTDVSDSTIFLTVMSLRLLVPLLIPRFPLPTVIAALVLDGLDQGIFAGFTNLDLENYQSYDKALDVYYLTIAYLSTMRNWTNLVAYRAARFLIYYRLVGTMLFELTGIRALLLVFPNTFEYFFIFIEIVALLWFTTRLTRNMVLAAVAFIWIVIKLPQEYWIHIAQRDASDFLLENPILMVVLAVLVVALVLAIRWLFIHRLPPPDKALDFEADSPYGDPRYREAARAMVHGRILDRELLEKITLISVVSIIFSQMLPSVRATPIQMTISVSILIVSNAVVSEWLARRNDGWKSVVRQFVTTAVLNTGLTITFIWILPMEMSSIPLASTLFFLLLITLLIACYDRFRPSYLMRADAVP